MATVYLASPTNNTMFTTCCEVAILDHQTRCPHCGQDVIPHGLRDRWEIAYRPIARGERWYGNWYPNHGK